MGLDQRPADWGTERPKVSAKLAPCSCGQKPVAHIDTAGMWSVECYGCSSGFLGADNLGFETWQECVREWNAASRNSAKSAS